MDLSILIPVYNSSELLDELTVKISSTISSENSIKNYEVFLIDDCSKDNSWEKIKHLSKKNKYIKGVKLKNNFGQHSALMCGLNECSGNIIITMDDDLQHSPESIINLINEIKKGYDVCYTKYLNRQHADWKKFVSWLNNVVCSYLLNKSYKIYMSSFRAFKKNISNDIIKYKGIHVYIDGLILKHTKNINIISVVHHKRPKGKSNYNFYKLVSLWADMTTTFTYKHLSLSIFVKFIVFLIVYSIRKILAVFKESKKAQYVIDEKTYS